MIEEEKIKKSKKFFILINEKFLFKKNVKTKNN